MKEIGLFLLLLGGMFLLGCGDATEPAKVTITSPQYGSIVSGTISIKVETTGEAMEVLCFLNGSEYWPTDKSAPFEFPWDTTHELNGSYTIKAEARFSSGKNKETEITVTVQN